VPLFLLMGGEIVVAFLLARIALWVLRGRRLVQQPDQEPSGPGGGGGFRAPAPARRAPQRAPARGRALARRARTPARRAA